MLWNLFKYLITPIEIKTIVYFSFPVISCNTSPYIATKHTQAVNNTVIQVSQLKLVQSLVDLRVMTDIYQIVTARSQCIGLAAFNNCTNAINAIIKRSQSDTLLLAVIIVYVTAVVKTWRRLWRLRGAIAATCGNWKLVFNLGVLHVD